MTVIKNAILEGLNERVAEKTIKDDEKKEAAKKLLKKKIKPQKYD